METEQTFLISESLAKRVVAGHSASQIAEAVASTWRAIEASLTPVMGKGGTAALYKRSVFLAARSHEWLETEPATLSGGDADALQSALSRHSPDQAARAGGTLLLAFLDLLTRLVGPSLTERLLLSAWAPLSSGIPAQDKDTSP